MVDCGIRKVGEAMLASESAEMRLSGAATEQNSVPSDVLVRTLASFQQLVYIMASDEEHKTVDKRFRIASDIEQNYKLMCEIPKAGSYSVPLTLPAPQLAIPGLPDIFDRVYDFLSAVAEGDMAKVERSFKDSGFVKRGLQEAKRLLPSADDSWIFGFKSKNKTTEIKLGKNSVKPIEDYLTRKNTPTESVTTITGELVKIDFDERKVFLRYPPTAQEIQCIYSDDLEDEMLENRRQYIQVTGKFTLNASNEPIKLTDVTLIEPLDLSVMRLSEVSHGGKKYRFKPSLQVTPELEPDEKQHLIVTHPGFDLLVYGRTREELVAEIAFQAKILWQEYALCPDEELAPEAKVLKDYVLAHMEQFDAA
jgi:hypothetical protein